MPREELIRIYRSDAAGATPSGLTSGEIAANLVDGKFFIGGTNGSLITFYSGVGVTGITTESLGYGQAGTNGLYLNGTTGGIVIQNTGVRALTVQGYGAITSPEWYQKGPQIRGGVGLSAVAGWDDTLTYIGPFIQFSNKGIITVNGVFYNEAGGNVNLTGDGGAVQGKANTLFTARLATTGATGVASFNDDDFSLGSTGHVSLESNVARTNRDNEFFVTQTFFSGIRTHAINPWDNNATISIGGASANSILLNPSDGDVEIRPTLADQRASISLFRRTEGPTPIDYWVKLRPQTTLSSNLHIDLPNGEGILALVGEGVTSLNGLTGAITLTGDGGSQLVRGSNVFTNRIATHTATGVASFSTADFVLGTSGHVSLTGTVAKTDRGQTFTEFQAFSAGISAATGSSIGGVFFSTTGGSPSYRIVQFPNQSGASPISNFFLPGRNTTTQTFGDFVFGLTAAIDAGQGIGLFKIGQSGIDSNTPTRFNKSVNFIAIEPPTVPTEGNIVIQSMDDYVGGPYPVLRIVGAVADGIYLSIDSLGGLSSASGAAFGEDVTVKGVLNAVGGLIASNVVNSINSLTGAVTLTGDGQSAMVRGNNTITNRIATSSVTGVARFDSRYFKVTNGLVTLLAQPFAQDYPSGPILPFGGIGATADGDGNLNAIYFDPGNLTSGGAIDPDNDTVIYFDASETGLVKTKKRAAKDLILDNSTLFASSKSQLIASKKGTTIDYDLVLGTIADGNDGLILGNDVYQYFKDSSNLVWSVNGCGGAVSITGTVNEIVVTKACPTITIGLPDNVSIPFLSGTGATFTQTVTANRFVGTISGGGF